MVKLENVIVAPVKPIFCQRHFNDTFNEQKKMLKILFSIGSTVTIKKSNLPLKSAQLNSLNFFKLCWRYLQDNDTLKTTELPIHRSSKIPKRYKRNAIFGDLHRAKRMSTNFDAEVSYFIEKFRKADYPLHFCNSIVTDFIKSTNDLQDSYIIKPNLLEYQKPFIVIEIPFCDRNEKKSKYFF